jgi:hypothetical protein
MRGRVGMICSQRNCNSMIYRVVADAATALGLLKGRTGYRHSRVMRPDLYMEAMKEMGSGAAHRHQDHAVRQRH